MNPPPTPLPSNSQPLLPVADLGRRWKLARLAAVRAVLQEGVEEEEELLVRLASERDPKLLHKSVFDNSRVLGLGFQRYYRLDLTLPDMAALLPTLGSPCHIGGFHRAEGEPAWQSRGQPCRNAGASQCSYWREATSGLVHGLSSTALYTRLESPGAGGEACVDLLHSLAQSPLRFRPIPALMLPGLQEISQLVLRINSNAKLEFLGITEGVLHYQLQAGHSPCGAGGLDLAVILKRSLNRRFPGLSTCDATGRPVLSESP